MLAQYEVQKLHKDEILLDRDAVLLKIKANQGDPLLFQTFFCVDCAAFVELGALFPLNQRFHAAHCLAWLPSVDEYAPGQRIDHISHWLEHTLLAPERKRWLQQMAKQVTTLNWVWVCTLDEHSLWLDYLEDYLEKVADSWLAALNGADSPYIAARSTWHSYPFGSVRFGWAA